MWFLFADAPNGQTSSVLIWTSDDSASAREREERDDPLNPKVSLSDLNVKK